MTKKVRIVSLACDTPTSPPLHFYKTLSKYVLENQSYRVHKILASGGRKLHNEEERGVSLAHAYWSSS